jgi:hypothetical protein
VKLGLLAALALLAACGDDGAKPKGDAGPGMDAPVVMPDAPVTPATLTSYVIDLVQHHTTAMETPRPASEFQALPDPDGSNGSAYAPLFP